MIPLWTLRIAPAWPQDVLSFLNGTEKRVANPLAFGAFWQLWRVRLAWDLSFKFVNVASFRFVVRVIA
jgi:hypothetical protein